MKTIQMLCLDFDETMTWGHSHQIFSDLNFTQTDSTTGPGYVKKNDSGTFTKVNSDRSEDVRSEGSFEKAMTDFIEGTLPSYLKDKLKFIQTGLKNPKELTEIMVDAINKRNKVSIVTFSLYPQMVFKALEYMFKDIQNKDTYLDQICVVSGFPRNKEQNAKEEHIQVAIDYFEGKGLTIKREDCLLVDDDTKNINKAKELGYDFVVTVPEENNHSNDYIDEIKQNLMKGRPASKEEHLRVSQILNENEYSDYLKQFYQSMSDSKFEDIYNKFINSLSDDAVKSIIELTNTNEEYTNQDLGEILLKIFDEQVQEYNDNDSDSDSDNDDDSDYDDDSDNDDAANSEAKDTKPVTYMYAGAKRESDDPAETGERKKVKMSDSNGNS